MDLLANAGTNPSVSGRYNTIVCACTGTGFTDPLFMASDPQHDGGFSML